MIGVRSFPARILPSALGSSIAIAAIALGGCGGAAGEVGAPSAKSPEAASASEPGSIDEAQAQIAAAQAQLGGGAGGTAGGGGGSNRFTPAPGASPAPSPAAPRSPSQAPAPPTADSSRPSVDDRCGSPCRALASMRRAVSALCRMTGNEDARCTDARRTLVDSEGRVAPCSC